MVNFKKINLEVKISYTTRNKKGNYNKSMEENKNRNIKIYINIVVITIINIININMNKKIYHILVQAIPITMPITQLTKIAILYQTTIPYQT
jgi:hypothetical protein